MSQPKVSIIMTTYNPVEEYFKIAIDSIIGQTFQNWELIVFDDGSENDVGKIINQFNDNRIIFKSCKVNRGISICANEAIQLSKGDFLAKIDDDDIAYPNWLETMMKYMYAHPNVNALGCSLKLIGNKVGIERKIIPKSREMQQANLLIQNAAIAHSLCIFRKSFWDKYKLHYDTRYRSAIDYALWVEMVKYTKFYALEDALGVYRRHDKQISTKTYLAQQNFADEIRWNQLRKIGIDPNNEEKNLHNKICRLQPLEMDELANMDKWIEKIKRQNKKTPYFARKALRLVLHQRVATLYLRYFEQSRSIVGLRYFLKYATLQNVKNGIRKIIR